MPPRKKFSFTSSGHDSDQVMLAAFLENIPEGRRSDVIRAMLLSKLGEMLSRKSGTVLAVSPPSVELKVVAEKNWVRGGGAEVPPDPLEGLDF